MKLKYFFRDIDILRAIIEVMLSRMLCTATNGPLDIARVQCKREAEAKEWHV